MLQNEKDSTEIKTIAKWDSLDDWKKFWTDNKPRQMQLMHDIPIAKITNDFIAYIGHLEKLNIEVASEFILVAATLMRIKAKMLLPRVEKDEEGNEIDPREDLVKHLLEYKKYKSVLSDLEKMESAMLDREKRGNISKELKKLGTINNVEAELQDVDLYKILKVYQKVMYRYENKPEEIKHGIQSRGNNYLVPVEANLSSERQVEYDCIRADRVLSFMEEARSKVNIVVLDACRNNPFERSWSRSTAGNGLAFMNAPSGSLIAYATSPGSTASDGTGSNGLYTESLLEELYSPDITILQMFQRVRATVVEKSGGKQIPWESTSLTGDFYFAGKNTVPINTNKTVNNNNNNSKSFKAT